MASLTDNGCHEVVAFNTTIVDKNGTIWAHRHAVRSDGALLERLRWLDEGRGPTHGVRNYSTTGLRLAGPPSVIARSARAKLRKYLTARGFTIETTDNKKGNKK